MRNYRNTSVSRRKKFLGSALTMSLVSVLAIGGSLQTASADEQPRMEFNDAGELIRPTGDIFREWVFVGSNITPADMNNINPEEDEVLFPGFHNTYIHPDDFAFFKENGSFRDGTQFIQENIEDGTSGKSGNGYYGGKIQAVKASVKSRERFPDRPGNWGFFKWRKNFADPNPVDASAVRSIEDCNQCHVDFADLDYVFIQHYPGLRDVDPAGE